MSQPSKNNDDLVPRCAVELLVKISCRQIFKKKKQLPTGGECIETSWCGAGLTAFDLLVVVLIPVGFDVVGLDFALFGDGASKPPGMMIG